MNWKMYRVEHPLGAFIGIARDEEEARLHWGARSTFQLIETEEQLAEVMTEARLKGPDRVLIAY